MISGGITNDLGQGIPKVEIQAIANGDTATTHSDDSGYYTFILPSKTVTIQANPSEGQTSDTTYTSITLGERDNLNGYNFVISP